jgi:hypothetical protein
MVDRMKDKDELALENLFRSEPIADDGFSRKVMTRLRRRIWLQRLAMPVAMTVGGLIAFKPAIALLSALSGVVDLLPASLTQVPVDSIPQLSSVLVVAVMVVAALCFAPALED